MLDEESPCKVSCFYSKVHNLTILCVSSAALNDICEIHISTVTQMGQTSIGATLYMTMVTCHQHFWKWWWLSPPLFKVEFAIFQAVLSFIYSNFMHNAATVSSCHGKQFQQLTVRQLYTNILCLLTYWVTRTVCRIFVATRSVVWPKRCRKCDSGRDSAPDPAGGAHDAPQTP